LSFQGGYAVDVEAGVKIGVQATNVHPVEQELALLAALSALGSSFNVSPIQMRETLFLRDSSGAWLHFDGATVGPIAGASLPRGRLAIRGDFEAVIFPDDPSQPASRFRSWDGIRFVPIQPQGEFMSDYAAASPEARGELHAVIFTWPVASRIVGQAIDLHVLKSGKETRESIDFPIADGSPIRLFTPEDLGIRKTDSVYVLSDRGEMREIAIDRAGQPTMSKAPNPIDGFVAATRIKGATYLLDSQGRLFARKGNSQKPALVPALEDARFVDMSRTFRSSPDLSFLSGHLSGERGDR
jgi:hypothetical protein